MKKQILMSQLIFRVVYHNQNESLHTNITKSCNIYDPKVLSCHLCTYRASGAGYGCVRILRLDFLFSKCLKLLYFGTLLQNFIWQTFSIGSEGVIFVKICSSKDSWGQQWGPDSYWLGSWCTSLFSVHTHKIVCLSLFGSSSLWQPAHCMWWVLRYAAFFTSIVKFRQSSRQFLTKINY